MYDQLRAINVKPFTENKDGLTYLSWAHAWDFFCKSVPGATYEIIKNTNGLPVFESDAGAMVYTRVTANGLTHEMWLPVMDHRNRAMKRESYVYKTSKGEQMVNAYTMMDINKTVMRCLVKNLAMFGLGIGIYAGEDLPDVESPTDLIVEQIKNAKNEQELNDIFKSAVKTFMSNSPAMVKLAEAKDARKSQL